MFKSETLNLIYEWLTSSPDSKYHELGINVELCDDCIKLFSQNAGILQRSLISMIVSFTLQNDVKYKLAVSNISQSMIVEKSNTGFIITV